MPLQTQLITLPFVKGVETKLDPKLVDGGNLLDLRNGSFAEDGSARRRSAFRALAGSGVPGEPDYVTTHNNELLTIAGETLYGYDSAPGTERLREIGTVSPCAISRTAVRFTSEFASQPDAAVFQGYVCHVWTETHIASPVSSSAIGVYALVQDVATGAVVFGPTLLAPGNMFTPRVVGVNATFPSDKAAFVVVWSFGAGIRGVAIELDSMTATAPVIVTARGENALDMVSSGGAAFVGYKSSIAGAYPNIVETLMLGYRGGLLVTQSGPVSCMSYVALFNPNVTSVALGVFPGHTLGIYALLLDGSPSGAQGIWAGTLTWTPTTLSPGVPMVLKDGLAVTVGASPSSVVTAGLHGDVMMVYADAAAEIEAAGSGRRTPVRVAGFNSSNAAVYGPTTLLESYSVPSGPCGPYIAGKPISYGGQSYLPMLVGSVVSGEPNLQNTWLLMSLSGRVVGRAMYGAMGLWSNPFGNPPTKYSVPSSPFVSGGRFLCPALERGQLSLGDGSLLNTTPVGVASLSVDFQTPHTSTQAGLNTFFSGGLVTQYDGRSVTEAAFNLFPEGLTSSLAAGTLTGTYQYCALYEWTDNNGQRHQSAPSVPITVTPSSQNPTITLPSLSITAKTGVTVVFFRTVNNGTTFYRLNDTLTPVSNTPTSSTSAVVSYTDSASDASIEDNEILYTTGGALENLGPGPCSAVVQYQNRLWMVGLEDPAKFAFSQAVGQSQGLAFNDALSGWIPQGLGGLTAVGVLDDKAVLYTAARKFVVFGIGPNADGLAGTYSTPQLLPADTGCIDPRSIVTGPMGQFFQSTKGLYLLNRALQDEYVGSSVEAFVLGNAVCAAVALSGAAQLRFLVVADDGGIGAVVGTPGLGVGRRSLVLTYDSEFRQWGAQQSSADILLAGACVWNGLITYAQACPSIAPPSNALGVSAGAPGIVLSPSISEGALLQDAPSCFRDLNTAIIPLTLTTQWIRLGQLSGFQRVRRLVLNGSYSADSTVTIGVSLNYDDTIVYTATLMSTGEARSNDVIQLIHHLARQKCQAIKFTITDTPAEGTNGAGCSFSGITLELGMKKGPAKLSHAAE